MRHYQFSASCSYQGMIHIQVLFIFFKNNLYNKDAYFRVGVGGFDTKYVPIFI